MPTFPTLSIYPLYPLSEEKEDSSIKQTSETGKVYTRARYTTDRKTWTLKYDQLTAADAALLEAFETTVRVCVDTFTWTHPASGTSYTVRYSAAPKFAVVGYDGSQFRWSYEATLVQV